MARLGRRQPNRPIVQRGFHAAAARTPPTFPDSVDLANGLGTRSFAAVTTTAGDWLVVEVEGEDGGVLTNVTPTCAGLTFTKQNDVGASGKTRLQQWTAPDAAGASRTVLMTPNDTVNPHWHGRLTVVRGSDGPGGKATAAAAQTVSLARTQDRSAVHMVVGDWSAGAVGTPTWTPGGALIVGEAAGGTTAIVGRWDDAGTLATASTGISSPAYTTPSIAVLEMLGTVASGAPSTNAPAELASGAGAAPDPTVDVDTLAAVSVGAGAALDPAAAVGVNAEAATGTGQASDATVSTANATAAPAEVGAGTGSALDPTVAVTIPAGLASGSGSAPDAVGAAGALAGLAAGTGAAEYDVWVDVFEDIWRVEAAQVAIAVNAGSAAGSGQALDATVSTLALTNAPAELASATGTAPDPLAAVAANAGISSGTGSALDATVQTGVSVPAELAQGAGTALDAATAVAVPAGLAVGAGQAPDAVGQVARDAPAGLASGTGAAPDAAVAIAVAAGLASGVGQALDAVAYIPPPVPPPRWVEQAATVATAVGGGSSVSGTTGGALVGAGTVEGGSSL